MVIGKHGKPENRSHLGLIIGHTPGKVYHMNSDYCSILAWSSHLLPGYLT